MQWLAAGCKDPQVGARGAGVRPGSHATTCSQLSSTISLSRPRDVRCHRILGRPCRPALDAERRADRVRNQRGIRQSRELDEPDAIGRAAERRSGLEREPRLATATGTGERDEAVAADQSDHLAQLALPAHEACELEWEVARPGLPGSARRGARCRTIINADPPREDVLIQAAVSSSGSSSNSRRSASRSRWNWPSARWRRPVIA